MFRQLHPHEAMKSPERRCVQRGLPCLRLDGFVPVELLVPECLVMRYEAPRFSFTCRLTDFEWIAVVTLPPDLERLQRR